MKKNICIIGQGYVGLPLALEFSKFFDVLGFDDNQTRINELQNNITPYSLGISNSNDISYLNLQDGGTVSAATPISTTSAAGGAFVVTGATSGCTGRVVDFTGNNTLRLTDIIPSGNSTTSGYNGVYGYFTNTEVIAANTSPGGSGASATANGAGAVTGGDLTRFSGDVLYVENRSPVTRASDQIEDIKLVIEF